MPPRSRKDQMIIALDSIGPAKASYEALLDKLGGKWTMELVVAQARKFSDDVAIPIDVVHGGVLHRGRETLTDPPLYREVANSIERTWKTKSKTPRAFPVGRAASKIYGLWAHPDAVIRVERTTAARDTLWHSLEIEQSNGFNLQSIYQAYEQGRGADYSWVFFTGVKPVGVPFERLLRVAKECGVGLVNMPKPTQPSGWDYMLQAKIREKVSVKDRNDFLERSGLTNQVPR